MCGDYSKEWKKIVVGSFYRLPNTSSCLFLNHVPRAMTKIQQGSVSKEVILGMDQNNDLIKSHLHAGTQEFLSSMLENELFPTVT